MTSAANSLRLCLRTSNQITSRLRTVQRRQVPLARRALSTSQARWVAKEKGKDDEDSEPPELKYYSSFNDPGEALRNRLKDETLSEDDRATITGMLEEWQLLPQQKKGDAERLKRDINNEMSDLRRIINPKRDAFWNDSDEKDTDLITDEFGEDDFEEDDMLSMSHGKLEEHREAREYARITVWEMPLLSQFAKSFQPPAKEDCLRFRYTTYMGELHPADRKVVVEFCPKDVPGLSEAQQLKLKKLAGPRYNPEKDIVKMSCERFEHQAQNKRYLGDTVSKMIETAKDPTDMFEDIPLDTRHHTFKVKLKYPKEWYINTKRREELEALRKQSLLLDEQRRATGGLIDGVSIIKKNLLAAVEPEPVMELRGGPRSGKMRR
ncbi:mitochondrial ribosomal subunit protein-domain-containing protein [Lasiosphaeria miniovina]|uniref:Small ribosomal subunit protein mS35 n=1 Tax=Lasiosphaeria miniovina TaxID=1954250 RepID=A0AA40BFH7_9PEZI|nr:mitochondrial ribosomal subunit protein-domain-containing protein [Lasiosphaeria miniovina]KAK0733272.1 mitochondrial ribosomal subunit protein-domain-containing protein [Lasiosphaeria miniovina]